MATDMGIVYCDTHIHLCYDGTVHYCDLLAIPMYERYTAFNIFNNFSKKMDAVFLDWRKTIIVASSDEERKMMGESKAW